MLFLFGFRLNAKHRICSIQAPEIDDSVFRGQFQSQNERENRLSVDNYQNVDTVEYGFRKRCASAPTDVSDEQNEFVKNILFDVCSDFERTLERASVRETRKKKFSGEFSFSLLRIEWNDCFRI